jgi:benzoylformate decarboxylase
VNVREATVALMRDLGMTTVFGNPGSTELRFLRDWPEDFRYVMGLHEGAVVAMADAFAQLTGNAAFVNLHSAGGVGNAMGAIFTANRNYAPLVIVAGQQTRAMLPSDPFLYAEDATTLPRPYVKWAIEPARAADVPRAILRAYTVAMQRPYGPAFVSVPEDDWDAPCEPVAARYAVDEPVPPASVIDDLAQRLEDSRRPAIVVGSGVDRDGAVEETHRLAHALGAVVFASVLGSRCGFDERDALFRGALPRVRTGVAEALREHDVVLVLGAPAFNYHIHRDGPFVREGTRVVQITDDPRLAAAAVTGTAILAALRPTLQLLLRAIAPNEPPFADAIAPQPEPAESADAAPDPRAASGDERITIEALLATLAERVPTDAIVVEEAPSTHTMLHELFPQRPGQFLTAASGSLGFGLPAAAGAALARPGRRVVALIGDGSAHYANVGLWSAARENLPITFVIVDNEGYGAMKSFVELLGSKRSPDFGIPGVDFVALAAGYGLPARRAATRDELAVALAESFAHAGPSLVAVAVDAGARKLF